MKKYTTVIRVRKRLGVLATVIIRRKGSHDDKIEIGHPARALYCNNFTLILILIFYSSRYVALLSKLPCALRWPGRDDLQFVMGSTLV